MVATLSTSREEVSAFNALLWKREPLADGSEPERRVVHSGVSWKRFMELDKLRGDDVAYPRFYYLDGELEIMTTSEEHERVKKWIAEFLSDYLMEIDDDIMPRGNATMLSVLAEAGAEPDESWCIGEQRKEFPDLVLEIALTSGGIRKLELYRQFAVPEVWIWRRGKLEIFGLRDDGGGYDPSEKSRLLPGLGIALLERCVAIRNWREARRTFRAGLSNRE